jgi:predicted dehydrogenase/threonine dehydrogenase-like Zn-dependent dehydrogenase
MSDGAKGHRMKQVSQNYKTGKIVLEEVSVPSLKSGGLLVRMHYSVISAGTEGMKVQEGNLSYLGKARARPDQVKQVLDTVQQQGIVAAYRKVMNKLDTLTPLGYSGSGEIVAVGPDTEGFHISQRVACAGAGYCNHAELNFVPKNLVVPVPEGVAMKHAAFAAIGAIALQGFRQGQMQLGETACVIGLGLLGQLLLQVLRAGGIRVIGVDLVASRCQLARHLGAQAALTPSDHALPATIAHLTDGFGADCIFITAAGDSNGPTELAVQIARDRGRVVDIGKTKLELPWNDYYMKELDIRFSRSYGPGRYDPHYEERGVDYPIGYVRWTERRNLAAFLDLIADGKMQLDAIISSVQPFAQAEQVYRDMAAVTTGGIGTVFEYDLHTALPVRATAPRVRSALPVRKQDKVRLGVIGAGNYASSLLLPHLKTNNKAVLSTVATTSPLSSENARRKFAFAQATTDYQQILADPEIDAVLIATRHSSHAQLVCEALRAGKATFVEKPLACSVEELSAIRRTIEKCGNDRLMVGFNRRFSPMVRAVAERFHGAQCPVVVHYRVHAGQLQSGSWYLDSSEGSRFLGESGHFLDVMAYVTQSRAARVSASVLRPPTATPDDLENFVVSIQYANGSVGCLLYLTQGGAKVPKEYVEVFGGGCTARLNNFETLEFFESTKTQKVRVARDKGQANELASFVDAVRTGRPMPISLEILFDTTLTTFASMYSVQTTSAVEMERFFSFEKE